MNLVKIISVYFFFGVLIFLISCNSSSFSKKNNKEVINLSVSKGGIILNENENQEFIVKENLYDEIYNVIIYSDKKLKIKSGYGNIRNNDLTIHKQKHEKELFLNFNEFKKINYLLNKLEITNYKTNKIILDDLKIDLKINEKHMVFYLGETINELDTNFYNLVKFTLDISDLKLIR